MNAKLKVLEDNRTWTVTVLPQGKRAVRCKYVYKIKLKSDGTVEWPKAKLVANTQREGFDCQETFSPVTNRA